MGFFSITSQFSNYGEYHYNRVNQLIHFIFVPQIVFSLLILLSPLRLAEIPLFAPYVPMYDEFMARFVPSEFLFLTTAHVGILIMCLVNTYYFLLDFTAATLLLIEFSCFYLGANYIYTTYGFQNAMFIGICMQIFSWGMQFLGHGVWEKRRPALVDNGLQIFIAPLFVMLEGLFFLGFKKGLKQKIDAVLEKRMKEYRAKSNNKKQN